MQAPLTVVMMLLVTNLVRLCSILTKDPHTPHTRRDPSEHARTHVLLCRYTLLHPSLSLCPAMYMLAWSPDNPSHACDHPIKSLHPPLSLWAAGAADCQVCCASDFE